MAIDIRATVTCSLGTLISGSISDDYIQGSGLVKTRGSVEISGTITPAIGTAVTFSYVKGGVTRSIPRKLRVMSSFADPFRRTTKVELGCKLTYLSDLKKQVDWTAFDDPENAGYDADDTRIVTLPIYARSVMTKCLTELGITASSNPLTNKFSIAEFDFSAGYVSVLSDLLVSESYCGYLDTNEVLQVFNLDQDAGTGPVFTASDIVDLGPIGVGQLPGEAITVSFSTLKLKQPDPADTNPNSDNNRRRRWERNVTTAGPNFYRVGSLQFSGNETTETLTTYSRIGNSDVPVKVITAETAATAKIVGTIGSAYVDNGIPFSSSTEILRTEEEVTTYDQDGNRVRSEVTTYEQALSVFGGVSLDYVFSPTDYVSFNTVLIPSSRIITTYDTSGNYQQVITSRYLLWPLTIPGQQAVAEYRKNLTTSAAVSNYVNAIVQSGLVHAGTTASINVVGETASRPDNLLNAAYAKGGDPNNGWRTESKADLELALGSATAQRRIEFSLPYAPDDIFSGSSGGPFTATPSDAPAKANRYGRVQNRLLLGNRNGINLQLTPEKLPAAPYSPLYVQANGLTALYRANGTNWAFDSNGIVCSVDALFWAAVGGTGTFWFPVAPGITTLPTTPPVVDTSPTEILGTIETVGATPQAALNAAFPGAVSGDGVQDETTTDFWVYAGAAWENVGPNPGPTTTATSTVLPYNETAIYDVVVNISMELTKFDYALALLTEVTPIVLKLSGNARSVVITNVPAANIQVQAYAPTVSSFDPAVSLVVTPFSYEPTGSALTVSLGFTPGIIWPRDLDTTNFNNTNSFDVQRGATKYFVIPDTYTTPLEKTDSQSITAFADSGFTVGTSSLYNNTDVSLYGGHAFAPVGPATSNTDGSIISTVSANNVYSIITYTGAGVADSTVGHGLPSTPQLIMISRLSGGSFYATVVGGPAVGNNYYMIPTNRDGRVSSTNYIRSANSTTFTLGTGGDYPVQASGSNYVAYAFCEKAGTSKISTYEGNDSSSGQYIECGFKVDFLIVQARNASGAVDGDWLMFDRSDNTGTRYMSMIYSSVDYYSDPVCILEDTGFTVLPDVDNYSRLNGVGITYLYIAFARRVPSVKVEAAVNIQITAHAPAVN